MTPKELKHVLESMKKLESRHRKIGRRMAKLLEFLENKAQTPETEPKEPI